MRPNKRKGTRQQFGWNKKGLYLVKEMKKRRIIAKRCFFADLTIVFVLVTVLSVSCSFGGWSIQIQRLEEREFWVPTCIVSHGMTVLVYTAPHAVVTHGLICQQSRYSVTSLVSKGKRSVSLKNACTCGGMADVLIAACDWLFFSQSWDM